MKIRDPHAAPTPAQTGFLTRLVRERQISEASLQADLDTLNAWLAQGATRGQVSTLIERFKGFPRRQDAATSGSIEIGMYVAGDDIFRVYKARAGSHLLVKRLEGSDAAGWSYTYVGAAARALRGMAGLRKMTLSEAQGWGKRTGTCCVCAAHLTDGESIDKGIGPVCERSFR